MEILRTTSTLQTIRSIDTALYVVLADKILMTLFLHDYSLSISTVVQIIFH